MTALPPSAPARAATTHEGLPLDTVTCGDALDFLKGLDDDCIDLIVTSPPYDNLRSYHGYSWDFEGIAQQSYRVLKQGGVLVWVVGNSFANGTDTLSSFRQALYFGDVVGFNVHQRITWVKEGLPAKRPKAYLPDFEDVFVLSKGEPATFNPLTKRNRNAGQINKKGHSSNGGFSFSEGFRTIPDESLLTNVWTIGVGWNKTTNEVIDHPAMFPEKLAERCVLSWSNPGDIVLDYFAGSGTTLKMARKHGRHYLGCDISQEYVDLIERRLAKPYMTDMFAGVP